MRSYQDKINQLIMHSVLLLYTLICMFPVYLLLSNSFKKRKAIFKEPLSLPSEETFSLGRNDLNNLLPLMYLLN